MRVNRVEIAATENFVISAYGENSKNWSIQYRLYNPEGRTNRRDIAYIRAKSDKERRLSTIELIDSLITQLNDLKAQIQHE